MQIIDGKFSAVVAAQGSILNGAEQVIFHALNVILLHRLDLLTVYLRPIGIQILQMTQTGDVGGIPIAVLGKQTVIAGALPGAVDLQGISCIAYLRGNREVIAIGQSSGALERNFAELSLIFLQRIQPAFPFSRVVLFDEQQQAERFGAKSAYAQVERMDLAASPKVLETSEGTFYARTVALATGANPRELGLPGEAALTGKGVAYCAACDGMRYRGKTVVVVGGGNSAAADAMLLSRIAQKVILVHRRDTLRATKVYHEPLKQAENIAFRWNSVVTELLHDDKLTGVKLKDVQTGEETVLPCDGVFISVGRTPATQLVQGQLTLDGSGYIVADETTRTNLPGVYAVGDVRTKPLRQVVTAVADGAMAVHMAEEFLSGEI